MKNIVVVLCVFLFLSCEKDKLPEATTLGEETIGMLVNGSKWQRKYGIGISPRSKFSYYNECGTLEIDARGRLADLYFTSYINGEGIYFLNKDFFLIDSCMGVSAYQKERYRTKYITNEGAIYYLADSTKSQLEITRFDLHNSIISGLFSITLINDKNEELKITKGRFDATVFMDEPYK